jgi:rRNA-processing protein FCF1
MKIAMDSDCLIKLTKAGLKEKVCSAFQVAIPAAVWRETVEQAAGLPDAERIQANVEASRIQVRSESKANEKGEEAVLAVYRLGGFDAVATDDRRFIRHLRTLGVPFAVPSGLVVAMLAQKTLGKEEAQVALEALRPHISEEQYSVAFMRLNQEQRA